MSSELTPASDTGLGDPIDEFLAPGAAVGDYVIEEVVNQGGFSAVYRARQADTGRRVALKVLWRELIANHRLVRRFEHEAKALLKLRHPNIVEIFELGALPDGRPFFAMEWLGGRNLRDLIRTRGAFDPIDVLAITEQICAGLGAAHRVGIVHRDLKAQNIMCTPRGDVYEVKLVDFGIAKVLEPDKVGLAELVTNSTILGTPFYMAPEQILGQAVDQRTDIYALGLLLYELVTGELPFRADSRVEVEEMHLHAPPPRPSEVAPVGDGFDDVLARCLEKDPARRYADVAGLMAELRAAVHGAVAATGPVRAGVAWHVEARLDPSVDDVPDEAFADVDAIVETARAAALAAELRIDLETPHAVLAVGLLPDDELPRAEARSRLIQAARALDAALAARPTRSPLVRVASTLHAAPVAMRSDAVDFDAGPLLLLGEWTAGHPGDGLAVTEALLDTLTSSSGLEIEPVAGRSDLFRVR